MVSSTTCGRFNSLADKIARVKSWPGIDSADVDTAVRRAHEDGVIAGFEAERLSNPLLDLVIVVSRDSISSTLLYGRARFMEAFEGDYAEWEGAYAHGVDEGRVDSISGAGEFQPNTIKLQVVDFGANWDPIHGNVLRDVQKVQVGELARFAALFNASQSPTWIRGMNGIDVPFVILGALRLSVPGYRERLYSPGIMHDDGAWLLGYLTVGRYYASSVPMVREYRS